MGSNGIYFGGKDVHISEVSGQFEVSAGVSSQAIGSNSLQTATLSIRVGSSSDAPSTDENARMSR